MPSCLSRAETPATPSRGFLFTPPSTNCDSGQPGLPATPRFNARTGFMDDFLIRAGSDTAVGSAKLRPLLRPTRSVSGLSRRADAVGATCDARHRAEQSKPSSPSRVTRGARRVSALPESQRAASCPSESRLSWEPPQVPSKNSTSLPSTPSRSFSPRALRAVPESHCVRPEFARPPVGSPRGEIQESLVDVFIRVRPRNMREHDEVVCISTEPGSVSVYDPSGQREHRFEFQGVIDDNLGCGDQVKVFEAIGVRAIQSALGGFDTCIFASGQTGTGKTHTIVGTPGDPGLLPRLLGKLLEGGRKLCWISCMELYIDRVRDLLADQGDAKSEARAGPEIHGSPKQGVQVANLSTHHFEDFYSGMRLVDLASRNRSMARTGMNATSSRGHVIFQLTMETGTKIHVVDLAGRENEKTTGCAGRSLIELAHINRSLFHLTNVIDSLARQRSQVPFRNSKLTLLLSECLQSARIFLVATISPSASCFNETLATLRHARSVRQIKTKTRKLLAGDTSASPEQRLRRSASGDSPLQGRRGDSPEQEVRSVGSGRRGGRSTTNATAAWPCSESVSSRSTTASSPSASSWSRTPREVAEADRNFPGFQTPEVRWRPR
eukprot:TRINITY_DN95132_c0_g1_i1.p1 TRINITY_DN95132_c0_g1~~TRINITY_DN95132_c0_g1_i1.p1  ORF type:complete len:645 (+),score=74.46 TRINITY_DN95132_c0_g1_i1:111-1937(+)